MQVREAEEKDKEQWNDFIRTQAMGSFLQSWEWGEFMAGQGKKIWRLVAEENGQWQAALFLFERKLKGGLNVLEAPRGLIMEVGGKRWEVRKSILEMLFNKVDEIAKQEKAALFQCEPQTNDEDWKTELVKNGFKEATVDSSPSHTLILNLQKSEEELLAQMQQKTRYNIRLAQKKGVTVSIDNAKFKAFYELQKQTRKRQRFTYYPEEYYKKLLETPLAKLYLAEFEGKIVAANIMIFWNDTATYLFGASDYNARQIMAPHLLQWQAIKDAKQQGMRFYDFWGVAKPIIRINFNPNTTNNANESKKQITKSEKWAGFTRFKAGFAPNVRITEYLGTYEKAYAPVKLGLYRFLRKVYKR